MKYEEPSMEIIILKTSNVITASTLEWNEDAEKDDEEGW